jgi:hypothetical protein
MSTRRGWKETVGCRGAEEVGKADPFRRHYPDQVLGSATEWSPSQPDTSSSPWTAPTVAPMGPKRGACLVCRGGRCETDLVKTRNLIIAAVITGTLIVGAFIIQFATDPRFLG